MVCVLLASCLHSQRICFRNVLLLRVSLLIFDVLHDLVHGLLPAFPAGVVAIVGQRIRRADVVLPRSLFQTVAQPADCLMHTLAVLLQGVDKIPVATKKSTRLDFLQRYAVFPKLNGKYAFGVSWKTAFKELASISDLSYADKNTDKLVFALFVPAGNNLIPL